MSYIINNSRGNVIAIVADGTVNTSATDLSLVGRALTDYGRYENENYVYLLENFANDSQPTQPITGQLWYSTGNDVLSVYSTANTWTNLATTSYVQDQKISPAFTGIPTAPTAASGTATTQIATTAFVTISPQFSGVPTAPTASAGTNTTQLATTAFVTSSPQFLGVPTAPTAVAGTNSTQIATTAFVTDSAQLQGTPTAPTAAAGTNTTQIATTEFVQGEKTNTALLGVPTAPTAAAGTNTTQIATTAFVQGEKVSPAFTGTPTAPTASVGTSTTQLATTQFVYQVASSLPSMAQQESNNVLISGGTIFGITDLSIADGGTGASTAVAARQNLGIGSLGLQEDNNIQVTGGVLSNVIIQNANIASLTNILTVSQGGTGAGDAANARTNLGLGSMATQNSGAVGITGGTITGLITPLPILSGGTGANTIANARSNLGLGNVAVQVDNQVNFTGGNVSGLTLMSTSNAQITGGSISGITDLAVADGGTGASDQVNARLNLGAAASSITIIAGAGLSGTGNLTANVTLSIAGNSNGFGNRYVSASAPNAGVGSNGDIWYQI